MPQISDEKALEVHRTVSALKRTVGKGPHDWLYFTTGVSEILAKLSANDLERLGNQFYGAECALNAEKVVGGSQKLGRSR